MDVGAGGSASGRRRCAPSESRRSELLGVMHLQRAGRAEFAELALEHFGAGAGIAAFFSLHLGQRGGGALPAGDDAGAFRADSCRNGDGWGRRSRKLNGWWPSWGWRCGTRSGRDTQGR